MPITTPTQWKAPFQVNTSDGAAGANAQYQAETVALTGGRFVVVWLDTQDPSGLGAPDINAQIFGPRGNPIGGELTLRNSFVDFAQAFPVVTALSDGGFLIAYETTNNAPGATDTKENVVVDRFDADGQATAFNLAAYSDANETTPTIAAFADDSYAVIYETAADAMSDKDIAGVIVSAANVTGMEFVIHGGAGNATAPVAATLSGGGFVVAYGQDSGGQGNIEFDIRTGTGAEVAGGVVASTAADETHPDVAALSGGGFVVTWVDAAADGAGNAGVRARIYDATGMALAGAFHVNTTTAGVQGEATVTALADGGFVVGWHDVGANQVSAQRYSATGALVGSEFVLAAVDTASDPRLELLSDGRFVATFTDTLAGNDNVFATIFDPRDSPIMGTEAADVITSRIDGATVLGKGGADRLIGFGAVDTLDGGGGNDKLDGGAGADMLSGGIGDDTYFVDNASDTVTEAAGEGSRDVVLNSADFVLAAGSEIEILRAFVGTGLTLAGNEFANILIGAGGADTLDGGAGIDKLTGGLGSDTFVFDTALGTTNVDRIRDFSVADDTIRLDDAIFAALATPSGNTLADAEFFVGAAAHDGDDRIIYNSANGKLMYDGDGDGAGAAVLFVRLSPSLALTHDDFFVV